MRRYGEKRKLDYVLGSQYLLIINHIKCLSQKKSGNKKCSILYHF